MRMTTSGVIMNFIDLDGESVFFVSKSSEQKVKP